MGGFSCCCWVLLGAAGCCLLQSRASTRERPLLGGQNAEGYQPDHRPYYRPDTFSKRTRLLFPSASSVGGPSAVTCSRISGESTDLELRCWSTWPFPFVMRAWAIDRLSDSQYRAAEVAEMSSVEDSRYSTPSSTQSISRAMALVLVPGVPESNWSPGAAKLPPPTQSLPSDENRSRSVPASNSACWRWTD